MTDMLTALEMQDLLQVDRSTIYRMAGAGKLPAIKVGRQWRFPADQVHAWLGDQAPAAAGAAPAPDAGALPVSCIQPLADLAADLLGVMAVVTDMNGYPLTEVSNPCGLFAAAMDSPEAIQRCIAGWQEMAATIELEPRFRRSHLGLLCARGLIRAGTSLTGMVFIGGIAPDDWPPDPDETAHIAAEFGIPATVVEDHLEDVYRLDRSRQAWVLSQVQRVADVISHMASERLHLVEQMVPAAAHRPR